MQTEERDRRLARLLAELSDQACAGRRPNLDAVAAEHPDLAAELRELWGAVLFADELMLRECEEPLVRGASDGRPSLSLRASEASCPSKSFGDYELLEELGRGNMGVVY